jgi:PAP2 superfamily
LIINNLNSYLNRVISSAVEKSEEATSNNTTLFLTKQDRLRKAGLKNLHIMTKTSLLLLAIFAFAGCDKNIEEASIAAYAPIQLDANGGTWKTYLPDTLTVSVPVPEAANTAPYLSEIAELKSILSTRTQEQEARANWWSTGATYRWHQITRDLAAKYNLPPVARPDGSYPVPDASKPFDEPRFPFANPPYASRAFAYLAVAQYEALVLCWEEKYKHNRKAPSKYDSSIKPLRPISDLPAYPSEDAVVAAASYELLKVMFPCEVEYLSKQQQEALDSRLWAGTNVRSDLSAGEAIGRAVAKKVLDRYKTDGMGAANQPNVDGSLQAIIDAAKALDPALQPWTSLDLPARPPLLPAFGNVKAWNLTSDDIVAVRPPLPPAIGSAEYNKDLEELRNIVKKQDREQMRIATFWGDGPGSYTPPGHWNRAAADLAYKAQFNELRFARTMALVGTSVQDAGVSCWNTKYYYYYPRPFQIDNEVTSILGTPNFPSYTSGHSTFSAAAAEMLAHLFPSEATTLRNMAHEASESRIFGTIHYRFDCEKGLESGKKIAAYAIERAKNDGAE